MRTQDMKTHCYGTGLRVQDAMLRQGRGNYSEVRVILGLSWLLFCGGSPTCILALGGVHYPSRSCNGPTMGRKDLNSKTKKMNLGGGELLDQVISQNLPPPPPPPPLKKKESQGMIAESNERLFATDVRKH